MKSEDLQGSLPADRSVQPDGYLETVKAFLSKLSSEQIKALENKYMYHVTGSKYLPSILNNGLSKDFVLEGDTDDFAFLESLYEKYGRSRDQDIFRRLIIGKDHRGSKRPIYLSTEPLSEYYEVPERIKYLLRNLDILSEAPYTSEAEKERCREILSRYKESMQSPENNNVVLEIGILSAPILNSLIGGNTEEYTHQRVSEMYDFLLSYKDADYQLDASIDPHDIAIKNEIPSNPDVYNDSLRRAAGVCFDEKVPGTPIDPEWLDKDGRAVYEEFKASYDRVPTQEELVRIINKR